MELDYALLARWARVNDDGTLTIIDGSFLTVTADVGSMVPLAVAGRVRFHGEPYQDTLTIQMEWPGGISVTYSQLAEAGEQTTYGDGRRHVLFALNTTLPVREAGLHKVSVSLEGAEGPKRDLFFTVEVPA